MSFVELLILSSEKAANIARVCRQDGKLFSLLIQEKKSDEANVRFLQDFKTLADVLIQATLRHDIAKQFPNLGQHVKGEENNTFTNGLGETISIDICSDAVETSKILEKVLDGDATAANILAAEVHKDISITDVNINNSILPSDIELDTENLGIWIDPIDSTAEYINGQEVEDNEDGLCANGLKCVTVLIGAYDRLTGLPQVGVVNQPFASNVNSTWVGKCYWGVCTNETKQTCVDLIPEITMKAVLSKIEQKYLRMLLTESGYKIIDAAGAGYKLLSVITGLTDVYIVSQPTTFQWDLCGAHACLKALGGDVFEYTNILDGDPVPLHYKDEQNEAASNKTDRYCNKKGLVAVRNADILKNIVRDLQDEI